MKDRIPSSRTSRCAGIELGVEALEDSARELGPADGGVGGLTHVDRTALSLYLTKKALELQKRATRALRGERW